MISFKFDQIKTNLYNIDSLVFQNGSKTTYYKSGQIKSAEYFIKMLEKNRRYIRRRGFRIFVHKMHRFVT